MLHCQNRCRTSDRHPDRIDYVPQGWLRQLCPISMLTVHIRAGATVSCHVGYWTNMALMLSLCKMSYQPMKWLDQGTDICALSRRVARTHVDQWDETSASHKRVRPVKVHSSHDHHQHMASVCKLKRTHSGVADMKIVAWYDSQHHRQGAMGRAMRLILY